VHVLRSRASWVAVFVLCVLTGTAATVSAMTGPAKGHGTSPLPTPTLATGGSCSLSPGSASITLSDMSPSPKVTVPVGARIVVLVPRWSWGDPTDVHVGNSRILSEECSILLADRGRRTILLAFGPGRSSLSATVTPGSDLMMPAWLGTVVVQDGAGSSH